MSMSPMQVLLVLHILTISIYTLSCLPVTSKPIENTPEHLAWEAWIMVPSTQDKTRKITPKSIFILPNKTNGGNYGGTSSNQIQCPPGHRVDNSRCIPTVNIDREQILIAQLTNLLHSSDKNNENNNNGHNPGNFSYEYDYDYGDSYDPEGSESLIQPGQMPSDYNGEPFKINLLLEKFPPKDDNKEIENLGPSEDISDILKVQPFRGEKTTTTTTTISTSIDPTSASTTTQIPDTTPRSEERNQSIPVYMDLSKNNHTSNQSSTVAPFVNPTTPIHLLSPSETEIASMVSSTGGIETDSGEDISFTDLTTMSTTIKDDEEIDIVTETEETRSDIKKDLIQESFVLDELVQKNNTELDESTDVLDLTTSTFPNSQYQEDETATSRLDVLTTNQHSSTINEDRTTNPLNPAEETTKTESRTNSKLMGHKLPTKVLKIDQDKQKNETPYLQEDKESFLDTIESNNRFVYHHLGIPFSHPTERITGNTQNIQEQLKIINRIVEENKNRRTELQSRIRFPSTFEEHEQRSHGDDHVRFPDEKLSHVPIAHPHYQTHGFPNEQHIWKNHPSGVTPSVATHEQKTTKPLWWLPNGWEVDGNGDRPLLLRFWSRAPIETAESTARHRGASSNPTTIGYRENSRSPTENLYKEVSAQEVYKVLGTKQWKHNR